MSLLQAKIKEEELYIELPETEKLILLALSFEIPLIAPQVAKKVEKTPATAYTLLERLLAKGFVSKTPIKVDVAGTEVRRIIWTRVFTEIKEISVITSLV